jgi:hypothetical protein
MPRKRARPVREGVVGKGAPTQSHLAGDLLHRTSGSAGGHGKPTQGHPGTAPVPDPPQRHSAIMPDAGDRRSLLVSSVGRVLEPHATALVSIMLLRRTRDRDEGRVTPTDTPGNQRIPHTHHAQVRDQAKLAT